MKILVLHGINLNMFGRRDPNHYGTVTLAQIDARLRETATELGVELEIFQSNFEGAMCERIHDALDQQFSAVVINAGAWTHYSYGLRDALSMLQLPVVEVHMSNVEAREPFRKISVFDGLACGKISGRGVDSYLDGLREAVARARQL